MALPKSVEIVEVGPRDGLQNEPQSLPAAVKVALIGKLAEAGCRVIEAGAFVSPKWVPQMADTAEVLAALPRPAGLRYPVLVPNMKGLERALECGVEEIAVFGAASETFSRRNINCSIAESLERFRPVCAAALAEGLRVIVCVGETLAQREAGETIALVLRQLRAAVAGIEPSQLASAIIAYAITNTTTMATIPTSKQAGRTLHQTCCAC